MRQRRAFEKSCEMSDHFSLKTVWTMTLTNKAEKKLVIVRYIYENANNLTQI